uniref:SFRICE_022400 n=1 Tax=Spodoptera frugiperda TaxID=7108 RepID=A0A2H1WLX3_SPOFR
MDDVTNILHRTYEVCMRINTDRKSQRTTVGQKARQADHLAWSEDPPFLRELYSLFPKILEDLHPTAVFLFRSFRILSVLTTSRQYLTFANSLLIHNMLD